MHSNSEDSIRRIMGQHTTYEQIQELKNELGLNRPLIVQYFDFLYHLIKFDLGNSIKTQKSVSDTILERFFNTFYLAFFAIIIAVVIGVIAGIISAVKQNSFIDKFAMSAALFGISTPTYLCGLILILLFIQKVSIINGIFGSISFFSFLFYLILVLSLKFVTKTKSNENRDFKLRKIKNFLLFLSIFSFIIYLITYKRLFLGVGMWDSFIQIEIFNFLIEFSFPLCIILPAITIGIRPAGSLARMTRSSMLEIIKQDYIRTAKAKGLSEKIVIFKHALKNSLIPVVTVIGLEFASLLSGAVLIETVFAWPGIGRLSIQALKDLDYPLVQGTVLFVAILFVTANLIVDISYAFLDPRIKYD
jgi:peptide/nickel transport system permease protein